MQALERPPKNCTMHRCRRFGWLYRTVGQGRNRRSVRFHLRDNTVISKVRGQQCSRRGSIEEHAIPRQLPAPPPPHTVAAAPSTLSRARELRACSASGDKMRAYCWACPPLRPSLGTKSTGGFAGSRTADSHPRCAHWAERTALRIDHTIQWAQRTALRIDHAIHFSECKKSHRSHNGWL